jgi:transmembrane sensor
MNETRQQQETPSARVRAEAAAWVARIHGDEHSLERDARLRAWLGESDDHRRAFDRLTRAWEQAGKIRLRARHDALAGEPRRRSRYVPWAAAAAATLVLAVSAAVHYLRVDAVVTEVGQQRDRLLPDGTRVTLNTNTRIEVNYDEHARRVRLIRGEAWFEVAKRTTWPFLVSVDGEVIRALGTSFIVRHDGAQDFSVTLVEGRVSVTPVDQNAEPRDAQVLAPGQRLVFSRHATAAVDQPDLTRVTAWRHGRVEFDATSLAEAAGEMNRYSKTRIILADADLARLRIGGVFRAGDSEEFVRIVTSAFGLRADRQGGDIVLSEASRTLP